MRLSLAALALLPALAVAQEQKPLGSQFASWLEKAKAYMPAPQGPIDAGAAAVANTQLQPITTTNWEAVFTPSWHAKTKTYGPDTWMVLVTGGNKTCQGLCQPLEAEFNKTVAAFAADKTAPRMGRLNCDTHAILCSTWLAGPPSLWYIQRPLQLPGVDRADTPIHVVRLNVTDTKARDIAAIHKDQTYLQQPRMDSWFHPFDGQLALWGVNRPLGYVLWGFSVIPSWSVMIVVSFMTRTFMTNRIQSPGARARAAQRGGAAGAPRPAAAAAGAR